jgi:hypothetical protein
LGHISSFLELQENPVDGRRVFTSNKEDKCHDQTICFGWNIAGTKAMTLKSVLGSSSGESVFFTLETNEGRRTKVRPTLFP